jgi:hypothetical protein
MVLVWGWEFTGRVGGRLFFAEIESDCKGGGQRRSDASAFDLVIY